MIMRMVMRMLVMATATMMLPVPVHALLTVMMPIMTVAVAMNLDGTWHCKSFGRVRGLTF